MISEQVHRENFILQPTMPYLCPSSTEQGLLVTQKQHFVIPQERNKANGDRGCQASGEDRDSQKPTSGGFNARVKVHSKDSSNHCNESKTCCDQSYQELPSKQSISLLV